MDFQQDFQSQFMSFFSKGMALLCIQCGSNQQYGIGSDYFGLIQLIFVDYEIFAQNRNIYQRACRTDILQASSEELFVCEDRKRRST